MSEILSDKKRHIFLGPSAVGLDIDSLLGDSWIVHRPASRGDINLLISKEPPSLLVLVDGYFDQCLSVGHQELREAIEKGWSVWGLSSMGAIRAYEMRQIGMHGYGDVYCCFVDKEDFTDDEVALLHFPVSPYLSVSEPLVNIRFALNALTRDGHLEFEPLWSHRSLKRDKKDA